MLGYILYIKKITSYNEIKIQIKISAVLRKIQRDMILKSTKIFVTLPYKYLHKITDSEQRSYS